MAITLEKILGALTGKENLYRSGRNFTKIETEVNQLRELNDNLASQVGTIETQTLVESYLSSRNISSLSKRGKLDAGLNGMTLVNSVVNGDFSDGTTGWTLVNGLTQVSLASGVLELLATASQSQIAQPANSIINNKYFVAAYIKSTSNLVKLQMGSTTKAHSGDGMYEWVYFIHTATTTEHNYAVIDMRISDWDSFYIDTNAGVHSINMTALEIEDYTEEQMLNFVRNGYIDGLQGATNIGVQCVGKNLFDKDTADLTGDLNDLGEVRTFEGRFTSDFIRIKYNTYYTKNYSKYYSTAFYDNNKNYISSSLSQTFLTPVGAVYLRVTEDISNINSFQLEEGDTVTTYEPYKSTSNLYKTLDGEVITLHRLPNWVCDEKDINGKYIKRIGEKTLVSSDITVLNTSKTNVDIVYIKTPSDGKQNISQDQNGIGALLISNSFREETDTLKIDSVEAVNTFYFKDSFVNVSVIALIVLKGIYPTLADAQKSVEEGGLAGLKIVYQKATPEIIDTNETLMIAEPNGHVFISSEGCLPANTISYPINLGAQMDGVIEAQKQHSELLKHQNVVNIEFDLRITALE